MGKRLTDRQLADLRRLHRSGASQKVLASRFGVSQSHVSRLVRGERGEDAPPGWRVRFDGLWQRGWPSWSCRGRRALSLLARDDELVLRLGDASEPFRRAVRDALREAGSDGRTRTGRPFF